VAGLGSIGYISSQSLTSSIISTTNFIGLSISSFSTAFGPGGIALSNITSTVEGLGSAGYISSLSLTSSLISTTNFIGLSISSFSTAFGPGGTNMADITSTVAGLGTAGYISSLSFTSSLVSTTAGLQSYISSFIDPQELASSVLQFISSTYFTSQLTSTVTGLGSSGYISSLSLTSSLISTTNFISYSFSSFSTAFGPGGTNMNVITSTVAGLGSSGYVSTLSLTSSFISTTNVINQNFSSFSTSLGTAFSSNLLSTVGGLGSAGYISSLSLTSSFISTTNFLNQSFSSFSTSLGTAFSNNLLSTVGGLGSAGYISTLSLTSSFISTTNFINQSFSSFSTAFGPGGTNMNVITSTVTGLGSAGYVSTLSLTSSFISTTNFINQSFSSFSTAFGPGGTNMNVITSTVTGLGSSGYVSTLSLTSSFISTTNFINQSFSSFSTALGPAGLTILNLRSTVGGLGQIYLSSIPALLSTSGLFTSSILASTITTSSLQVNSLVIGTGTGWVNLGPLQTVAISSIQENTNALYANTSYFGTTSTVTALQFYGLFGNYNNTVLSEVSTGAGTQEFLVFKGSSSSDRVRVQTTGNFVVETGVSARLWSNTTLPTLSNTTPAFIINTSSNVGIQTATPGATLDVAGTARAVTLSSQQLFVSSFNGDIPIVRTNVLSTVAGLGSSRYISSLSLTSSLISTTNFINQSFSSFSTAFGPGGGVTTANLLSTVASLGSIGYISSASLTSSLVSTTAGLQSYISSFIDPQELASSVLQFISSTYFTSQLTSTVTGLGSSGYVSSASLLSTTSNIIYNYGQGFSTLSTAIYSAPFIYPGQLLYLNYGISTGTSNYKALQTTPTPLNLGYIVSTPIAGNTISSVASFQSDFFVPTFIPAGFWENRFFAYATGAGVTAFTELYDRSPLGIESLIKTTSTATTSILTGTSPQENIINMNVPYSPISTGHTIVWKIYASNATAVPRTIYSYFEDGNTYSYLITTFGGTAGYNFPATFSTLAQFTSNTSNYYSTQIVSTNSNLVSTVEGLGSAGYVSSFNNIDFISVQKIVASSITTEMLTVLGSNVSYYMSSVSLYSDYIKAQTSLVVQNGSLSVGNSNDQLPFNAVFYTDGLRDVKTIYGFGPTPNWVTRVASNDSHYGFGLYERPDEILTLLSTGRVGVLTSSPKYSLDISGSAFVSTLKLSSLQMIDTFTNTTNFLTVSSGVLQLNGAGITGGSGGAGVAQILAGTNISLNPAGGTGVVEINATGGLTSEQLISTTYGIEQIGYVSSPQLISTTDGIIYAVIDLVNSLGTVGYISSTQLISTVEGLGSAGYLSSGGQGYFSTLYVNMLPSSAPFWDSNTFIAGNDPEPNPLAVDIFGSARILKNLYIGSTTTILGTAGLKTDQVSSQQLLTSTIWLYNPALNQRFSLVPSGSNLSFNGASVLVTDVSNPQLVSTPYLSLQLLSTVQSLGTVGYISSASLTSSLVSTVAGLGTGGLTTLPSTISSFSLLTSSIFASTIRTTILSTQQIFTSSITGNVSQFATLSSYALYVSSFYTATRQATPMFVTF
jgi:hypothetical protein